MLGGMILYPLAEEILRFFDEFSNRASDQLTTVGVVLTGPNGSPHLG